MLPSDSRTFALTSPSAISAPAASNELFEPVSVVSELKSSACRRGGVRRFGSLAAVPARELASVDGRITPTTEAVLPLPDDGLYRGDGVFEVIRLYGGARSRS